MNNQKNPQASVITLDDACEPLQIAMSEITDARAVLSGIKYMADNLLSGSESLPIGSARNIAIMILNHALVALHITGTCVDNMGTQLTDWEEKIKTGKNHA